MFHVWCLTRQFVTLTAEGPDSPPVTTSWWRKYTVSLVIPLLWQRAHVCGARRRLHMKVNSCWQEESWSHTERQTERHWETLRDRQRDTERQTERHWETDREREREREKREREMRERERERRWEQLSLSLTVTHSHTHIHTDTHTYTQADRHIWPLACDVRRSSCWFRCSSNIRTLARTPSQKCPQVFFLIMCYGNYQSMKMRNTATSWFGGNLTSEPIIIT